MYCRLDSGYRFLNLSKVCPSSLEIAVVKGLLGPEDPGLSGGVLFQTSRRWSVLGIRLTMQGASGH